MNHAPLPVSTHGVGFDSTPEGSSERDLKVEGKILAPATEPLPIARQSSTGDLNVGCRTLAPA
jgi:hypothetical protein